jgi:hypothetical protein
MLLKRLNPLACGTSFAESWVIIDFQILPELSKGGGIS